MEKIFFVHLFHIFFVGVLFLYVGITKTNVPAFIYPFLIVLGIFLVLYQGYKAFKVLKMGKNPWINLFHLIIVAPLVLYIGINGKKTPYYFFEFLLMLGFAVIGYHGYYLFIDGV